MRKPWTEAECRAFLHSNQSGTIVAVSLDCGRSVPAILHMRRKLKRLTELGARPEELPKLLTVSTWSVERCGLREIRRRAQIQETLVRNFVRRNRVTGRPLLVSEHKRNRATS